MKRMISLFLVSMLLISACFPASVSADIVQDYKPPEKPQEEYTYSIENGEVFLMYFCSYSTVFEIPEIIEGHPVTKVEFGNAFVDDVVKAIYIPKTVKDVGTSINYGNRGLQTIVVDDENPYYSSVDGVLYNKDKTVLITYPAAKKGEVAFVSTIQAIGKSAFSQCSGVTRVSIPEGITSIEYCTFWGNENLISIEFPDSLISIGFRAFYGCSKLQNLRFPDGLKTIGAGAFEACQRLQIVEFPDGITQIGEQAFFDCPKLLSVLLPSSIEEIGTEAFGYIDYSSMDCMCWEPNPNFIVFGWDDTVAEAYAGGAGSMNEYNAHRYNFISLDYFSKPDHPPVRGDVNADRSCSSADALHVLKIIVGKLFFHESQISAADIDEDGKIAAADALGILKIVVGKDPSEEKFIPFDDTTVDMTDVIIDPLTIKVRIKKKYSRVNKIWTAKDFPQLKDDYSEVTINHIEDLTWADTPEEVEAYQNDPEFCQLLAIRVSAPNPSGNFAYIHALSQNGYLSFAEPYYIPIID